MRRGVICDFALDLHGRYRQGVKGSSGTGAGVLFFIIDDRTLALFPASGTALISSTA